MDKKAETKLTLENYSHSLGKSILREVALFLLTTRTLRGLQVVSSGDRGGWVDVVNVNNNKYRGGIMGKEKKEKEKLKIGFNFKGVIY